MKKYDVPLNELQFAEVHFADTLEFCKMVQENGKLSSPKLSMDGLYGHIFPGKKFKGHHTALGDVNAQVVVSFIQTTIDTKKHLYRKKLIATRPLQRNYASHLTASTPSNAQLDQLTTKVLCLRCDQLKLTATGSCQTLLVCLHAATRSAENMIPPDPEPTVIPNDLYNNSCSRIVARWFYVRAVQDLASLDFLVLLRFHTSSDCHSPYSTRPNESWNFVCIPSVSSSKNNLVNSQW
ncbi:Hypothetical predicted protein [Paramuricea clavata]|uniref:Uncharacterized protein n=1 Tax=Paramuricea clavata TaxID=317549 RepID=A0A6S7GNN4_PARCT|nr:Hypothetical predicted protein [Paramuricea clavata]